MNDELRRLVDGHRIGDNAMSAAARLMEQQSSLARLAAASPLQDSIARLHKQLSANAEAFSAFSGHSEMLRAALGPSEDIKRLTEQMSVPTRLFDELRLSSERYADLFKLPDLPKIESLLRMDGTVAQAMEKLARLSIDLKRAMEAMDAPWLNMKRELDSLKGFAALQGVGSVLNNPLGFDDRVADALRLQLGDFRDAITFPPDIFENIASRSAFYVERGFNSELTDFPAPAFRQGLRIAHIEIDAPPPLAEYLPEDELRGIDTEEEEGFRRTNAAHDKLQRIETQLRRFIDVAMTASFGADWARTRLPNGVYDIWMEKRSKAESDGRKPYPLVAYADFTEYELIICKRDNWPVFKAVFVRPESVRESFQRLAPLRIATMHARLITQDDELFLVAELKRLLRAIQRANHS